MSSEKRTMWGAILAVMISGLCAAVAMQAYLEASGSVYAGWSYLHNIWLVTIIIITLIGIPSALVASKLYRSIFSESLIGYLCLGFCTALLLNFTIQFIFVGNISLIADLEFLVSAVASVPALAVGYWYLYRKPFLKVEN